MKQLLAKSWVDQNPPDSASLSGHLSDVYRASVATLQASGHDQLDAFSLRDSVWGERLSRVVSVAAAIHDLGKANPHFQAMIRGDQQPQPLRHEWLSVWVCEQLEFKKWILPALNGCEKEWHAMVWSIAGHHPNQNRSSPTKECFDTSEAVTVLTDHQDFLECLQQIADWFQLDAPPELKNSVVHSGANDHEGGDRFLELIAQHRDYFAAEIEFDDSWRRFCACAKACLIAADVAGSALWEHTTDTEKQSQWIQDSLTRRPSANDLRQIVCDRLGDHKLRDFQTKIAGSTAGVTLVEAGCGSGKTLSAYKWSEQQHAGRRLWFCYPTTGTATEGFRGYLLDAESRQAKHGAELFHSRSAFDKIQLLDGSSNGNTNDDDTSIRVESLKAWDTKIVACTVDTLLCLMQNQRRGLYAWPAIAQSAIVLDEVHCYDEILFGNLLMFLRELRGIPVLLMTASLPTARREAIEKASTGRSFQAFTGPADLESLPRYLNPNANELASRSTALQEASQQHTKGGRVLWVSNTVDRTRDTAESMESKDPIVYHSRFIYKDRIAQHIAVTDLFDSDEPGLAMTSQVAEMSLDLAHTTLLVTELAPIPALIQRLGRLNRRATPDDPLESRPPRTFLVIEPLHNQEFSSAPYEESELLQARQWLDRLGLGPLSQQDLVDAWHALEQSKRVVPTPSSWLLGGIETPVNPIRKSGYGVTVIRDCDVQTAREENSIVGYTLPMNYPAMKGWETGRRLGGFLIAVDGTIEYSSKTGGKWSSCLII